MHRTVQLHRRSVDPLAFGRRGARELGDGCKDAFPDCAPVRISSLEQLIGSASSLDRRIGTVALYQNVGRTQDIEISDHRNDGSAGLQTGQEKAPPKRGQPQRRSALLLSAIEIQADGRPTVVGVVAAIVVGGSRRRGRPGTGNTHSPEYRSRNRNPRRHGAGANRPASRPSRASRSSSR